MPNFDLQVAIADTVKELLKDSIEHGKAVTSAISPDGTVMVEAVAGALPWQSHDGRIAGPITTGSNQLSWSMPQGGTIRHVGFDVRTAPTGGNLTFTISGGTTTQTFSLQAGQTSANVSTNIVMIPGAWARINITAANGAADLSVTLQYQSNAVSGGTNSGSGGGGGGTPGAVVSVNGNTGVVILDPDSFDDTATTHKFVSAAEKTKLANTSGVNTGDQDLSSYVTSSSLHIVATTGQYSDLAGRPTLGDMAAKNDVSVSDINASGTPGSSTYLRGDGTWSTPAGGGGGAVDSVNGQTGTVVLDADDIDDTSTSHKFASSAELTKLSGIATGATANATDAQLRDRSTHTGSQEISTVTGLQAALDSKASATAIPIPFSLGLSGGNKLSTTNVSPTWATATSKAISLPNGTYQMVGMLVAPVSRSVTTGGVMVRIWNGATGTDTYLGAADVGLVANGWFTLSMPFDTSVTVTGGSMTLSIDFTGNGAGTTFVRNVAASGVLVRTS